jgi:hypothetical protein
MNYKWLLLIALISSCTAARKTTVTIKGNQFYINGELTYKNRVWKENKIEGLLFNSRMVQGIFDDLNDSTKQQFAYADTHEWNADRNTNEFIAAMESWKQHGLLAFTLNLQGGSPLGYGNKGWINSAFDGQGNLRKDYMQRLKKILNKADQLNMVVILGYFYFGQDQLLTNEQAVLNAVDNITNWILANKYKNIIVEINNECDISYDHAILQPARVHELIERVKQMQKDDFRLLVSTSYGGGVLPKTNVVQSSDFVLLHGNGVEEPKRIVQMIAETKQIAGFANKPILFNEDDHFNFEADSNHFVMAVQQYASWGYFDYRLKGEGFENGFQSVPVDWKISSDRKKQFFAKMKEISGY